MGQKSQINMRSTERAARRILLERVKVLAHNFMACYRGTIQERKGIRRLCTPLKGTGNRTG